MLDICKSLQEDCDSGVLTAQWLCSLGDRFGLVLLDLGKSGSKNINVS